MYSTVGERSGVLFNSLGSISLCLSHNMVMTITWAFGLLFAVPPLIGWSFYVPEPSGLRYVLFVNV